MGGARSGVPRNGRESAALDWAALIPLFVDIETIARDAREALEQSADHGEPEPLRQARLIFRMLEAASGVIRYAWIGGDHGYGDDVEPWSSLGGQTMGMLPTLREFVASVPE